MYNGVGGEKMKVRKQVSLEERDVAVLEVYGRGSVSFGIGVLLDNVLGILKEKDKEMRLKMIDIYFKELMR